MTQNKVLLSALMGTLMYVLVSAFFGPDGLWAASQLEEQKQVISANFQKIKQINENLSTELNSLIVDPEVIASYAKKLGYIEENEKIIRLRGLNPPMDYIPETGTPVLIKEVEYVPEWVCKTSGIVMFLFSLLLVSMHSLREKLHKRQLEEIVIDNPEEQPEI
jgi:cell division protein FtsB